MLPYPKVTLKTKYCKERQNMTTIGKSPKKMPTQLASALEKKREFKREELRSSL